MKRHEDIDRRSLALARATVAIIDADPCRRGFLRAMASCRRWEAAGVRSASEWRRLLESGDWAHIRRRLLDPSEEGCRLRQNSPFAGLLPPRKRWAIYRRFRPRS